MGCTLKTNFYAWMAIIKQFYYHAWDGVIDLCVNRLSLDTYIHIDTSMEVNP
jgi:hypothetical protein